MSRLFLALPLRGLPRLGSQQVARSNAATAAAQMMLRRREREAVDAYLAQRLPEPEPLVRRPAQQVRTRAGA